MRRRGITQPKGMHPFGRQIQKNRRQRHKIRHRACDDCVSTLSRQVPDPEQAGDLKL